MYIYILYIYIYIKIVCIKIVCIIKDLSLASFRRYTCCHVAMETVSRPKQCSKSHFLFEDFNSYSGGGSWWENRDPISPRSLLRNSILIKISWIKISWKPSPNQFKTSFPRSQWHLNKFHFPLKTLFLQYLVISRESL